jgi:hypothetical protein
MGKEGECTTVSKEGEKGGGGMVESQEGGKEGKKQICGESEEGGKQRMGRRMYGGK